MKVKEIGKLRPWRLAKIAGLSRENIAESFTASYGPYSPGAQFLSSIRDAVTENLIMGTHLEDMPTPDILNDALPMSHRDTWAMVAELGAWSVELDAEQDGTDGFNLAEPGQLAEIARAALWVAGTRLVDNLLSDLKPGDLDEYGEPEVFAERYTEHTTRWVVVLDGKRIVAGAETEAEARKMANNWLTFFPERPADWATYRDDNR